MRCLTRVFRALALTRPCARWGVVKLWSVCGAFLDEVGVIPGVLIVQFAGSPVKADVPHISAGLSAEF
jgi:hypothetical protein